MTIRRMQLGNRRNYTSIPLLNIQAGKQLERRDNILVEYVFVSARTAASDTVEWYLTDGLDYKQKFTIQQLAAEDGLSQDMPNIWWETRQLAGATLVSAALVRFSPPMWFKNLSLTATHPSTSYPVRYEIMALVDDKTLQVPGAKMLEPGAQEMESGAGGQEYQGQVPLSIMAGPGDYDVPLARAAYTRDVVLQNNTVPMPETDVRQFRDVQHIITGNTIMQETRAPAPGPQDRYVDAPSRQPVYQPPLDHRQNLDTRDIPLAMAPPAKKKFM